MRRPVLPPRKLPLAAIMQRRPVRRLQLAYHRVLRALTLSQRFLIAAVFVVAVAMGGLGNWIGVYLQQGITEGVAATAAASIDSLVSHQIGGLTLDRPPTPAERARLDAAFAIGNDTSSTRLLQIKVLTLAGATFYQAMAGLTDPSKSDGVDLERAGRGEVSARIIDIAVAPVGPISGYPLTVLEIYTPLHRADTGEVFAIAELYYGAQSVLDLREKAQRDVWALVGLSGLVVIAALYLLVNRASQTIASQGARLAQNLAASRQLSEENRALHDASERLRINATYSNESLLAKVGSDIHDGPIQLLTLIILKLTRALRAEDTDHAALAASIDLASSAMDELRNISTGLVLPELNDLDTGQALALAISRHEDLTGTRVTQEFGGLPGDCSIAVKTCGYRVIQEALSNAFRHGGGVGQRVTATADARALRIEVSNATPKQVAAATPDDRLGLRGMRFRVESLGGTLQIDLAGEGTARVVATLPLGTPVD